MTARQLTEIAYAQALAAHRFCGKSIAPAARLLGLNRSTFESRLKAARAIKIDPELVERFVREYAEGSGSTTAAQEPELAAPNILASENRVLKEQLNRAEQKLHEVERDNLSARQIREYIFGLKEGKSIEPKWINQRTKFNYHHGIPCLMLSDLHHGEVVYSEQVFGVNEFNAEISERRIKRVVDSTVHLTQHVLAEPKYPGMVLVLGGDLINGSIHDELEVGSDRRIMRQTIEVADIIHQCVQKLLSSFERVFVVGVAGNHGRTTRKPWAKFYAETNFDWLVYQMLERFMQPAVQSGRLQFLTPPAPDVTFRVAGRRFRLTHGDQFRGGDGVIGYLGPTTRGNKKKQAMALSLPSDDEQYDTLLMGHFHSLHMSPSMIINGSTKGYDEYALRNNFTYEPPQQALFMVHERYGLNHYVPVLADEPAKDPNKLSSWVEWR